MRWQWRLLLQWPKHYCTELVVKISHYILHRAWQGFKEDLFECLDRTTESLKNVCLVVSNSFVQSEFRFATQKPLFIRGCIFVKKLHPYCTLPSSECHYRSLGRLGTLQRDLRLRVTGAHKEVPEGGGIWRQDLRLLQTQSL